MSSTKYESGFSQIYPARRVQKWGFVFRLNERNDFNKIKCVVKCSVSFENPNKTYYSPLLINKMFECKTKSPIKLNFALEKKNIYIKPLTSVKETLF